MAILDVWRNAVRSVAGGELWISRRVAGRVLRELLIAEQRREARKLTQREKEILKLIGSGQSNRDMPTVFSSRRRQSAGTFELWNAVTNRNRIFADQNVFNQ